MAAINYAQLRSTMVALVKAFGKTAPMSILRVVEGSPADAAKPWRGGTATVQEFRFIGVALTLETPRLGVPTTDDDKTFIVPGDIVTTAEVSDPNTLCGDIQYTDRVLCQGIEYQVIGKQDITPDALPIIYKLRGRAWPQLSSQPPTQF
jgi:hypothetical protein